MARRREHVRTSEEKCEKMTEAKCDICCSSSFQESLLSCHSCITVQHSFCLDTPLVAYPDRRWICPACTITGSRPSRKRRRTMTSSTGTRHEVTNGKMAVGKSEVINSTTSVTSIAVDQVSSPSNASSSGINRRRSRISPQAAASGGTADNISVKTLPGGAAEASSQLVGAQTLSEEIPNGGASEDPGSTITIFCRRDFRRYLRWKRQKLEIQDDEKRREEKNRARKTFSSIIANANALC